MLPEQAAVRSHVVRVISVMGGAKYIRQSPQKVDLCRYKAISRSQDSAAPLLSCCRDEWSLVND